MANTRNDKGKRTLFSVNSWNPFSRLNGGPEGNHGMEAQTELAVSSHSCHMKDSAPSLGLFSMHTDAKN
jgi:hypothetical protein